MLEASRELIAAKVFEHAVRSCTLILLDADEQCTGFPPRELNSAGRERVIVRACARAGFKGESNVCVWQLGRCDSKGFSLLIKDERISSTPSTSPPRLAFEERARGEVNVVGVDK